MAEVLKIANSMFKTRTDWYDIPDEEKEECFFIFQRYFSKKYPEKAQLLNLKGIDKVIGMEIWFQFMKDKPYPKWFWSKGKKEKVEYTDSEIQQLLFNLDIHKTELDALIQYYPELVKDELKYLKYANK